MHINYKRGETRALIRKEPYNQHDRRRRRGRKGLADWRYLGRSLGVRNWCPCCLDAELRDHRNTEVQAQMTRTVHRYLRQEDKRLCKEGLEEYYDLDDVGPRLQIKA